MTQIHDETFAITLDRWIERTTEAETYRRLKLYLKDFAESAGYHADLTTLPDATRPDVCHATARTLLIAEAKVAPHDGPHVETTQARIRHCIRQFAESTTRYGSALFVIATNDAHAADAWRDALAGWVEAQGLDVVDPVVRPTAERDIWLACCLARRQTWSNPPPI